MESKMTCDVSKMWTPKMPKGLNLEISHHPLTMRQVVNLIIAMERLKAGMSETALGTEFRDENLLNIMMDSIVEEHIVLECHATPSNDFCKVDEFQCDITDSQKRSLVQVPNSMELHAVSLQGGAQPHKVYLNLSTYSHLSPNIDARPVALGIAGTDFYLSCHKDGDEPTLHLETVTNRCSLSTISPDSDLVRFLFYKHISGLNNSTLMSARFPNWYISTAQQDNMPVEMCVESANCYKTFTISELQGEDLKNVPELPTVNC